MTLERLSAGSRRERRSPFFPRVSNETKAGVALRRFRWCGEQDGEPSLILVDVERPLIEPFAGRCRRTYVLPIEESTGAGRGRQCSKQRGPLQQGSSMHV